MPDEERNESADARSPEEQAFVEDLKAAGYENAQIYGDASLPQIYRCRFRSSLLSDHPTIFGFQIDGDVMRAALMESDFKLMSRSSEVIEGYEDFEAFRRDAEKVPEFTELLNAQWKFLMRNLPPLFSSMYDLAVLSSFATTWLSMWRENPDDGLNEFEILVRSVLEKEIDAIKRNIKLIVETRPVGRPAGSTKSQEEKANARAEEAREFEERIEDVIRNLLTATGKMATKTAVAKELGIGGLSPKTGVDSSLNAFNNRLKRLGVDYGLIVERAKGLG